jgi:hypothetical protein
MSIAGTGFQPNQHQKKLDFPGISQDNKDLTFLPGQGEVEKDFTGINTRDEVAIPGLFGKNNDEMRPDQAFIVVEEFAHRAAVQHFKEEGIKFTEEDLNEFKGEVKRDVLLNGAYENGRLPDNIEGLPSHEEVQENISDYTGLAVRHLMQEQGIPQSDFITGKILLENQRENVGEAGRVLDDHFNPPMPFIRTPETP